MAGTGGARPNAGRKKKVDEEKANSLFCRALREIYNKEKDDNAKVEFIKDLLSNTRGQIFVAEHIFGKSPDKVQYENVSTELSIEEKKKIIEELKQKL